MEGIAAITPLLIGVLFWSWFFGSRPKRVRNREMRRIKRELKKLDNAIRQRAHTIEIAGDALSMPDTAKERLKAGLEELIQKERRLHDRLNELKRQPV